MILSKRKQPSHDQSAFYRFGHKTPSLIIFNRSAACSQSPVAVANFRVNHMHNAQPFATTYLNYFSFYLPFAYTVCLASVTLLVRWIRFPIGESPCVL